MKEDVDAWHGLWHLMSAPDIQFPGTLRTDSNSQLVLEIIGELGTAPDGMPSGQHRLVGYLDNLQSVSLDECFVTRGPEPFARTPRQTWHVGEALFGAHSTSDEPWTMRGADFEITGLTKWARWTAFDIKASVIDAATEPLPLWNDDGITVDIIQRVRRKDVTENFIALDAPMTLRIRAKSALTRDDLRDTAIRPLQTLIGLATGEYAAISRQFAVVPLAGKESRLTEPLDWRTMPITGNLDPLRATFGFSYRELRSLSEGSLQNAYLSLRPLHLVLDLYLASLRETGYAEVAFNFAAQALESYHRLIDSRSPLPQTLWGQLRKDLESVITDHSSRNGKTEELQNAYQLLSRKLPQLNQIVFRDRLKELLEKVGPHANVICGSTIDSFLTSVIQTRNFYVHWDEKPGSQVVRGADAIRLKSRMLALLEILLLQIVGLPAGSAAYEKVLFRRLSWI